MKNTMKRIMSFALVLLMVLSMMPQIAIGAKAADTMTIYFENNWNWPDAKIYWWGSTTGTNPAWNGVEMTYVDTTAAGYDRYKIEVPTDITGMLFNGTGGYGTDQSADITSGWYDGICYYMTYDSATNTKPVGSYKYESLVTPSSTPEEEPTTAPTDAPAANNVTVYCINSAKWAKVVAYAWDASGSPAKAWPGTAMTKTGETVNGFDVYSATFDAKYVKVIFNNNNSGSQTADLTVQAGKYYDVKSGTWYASLSDVPAVDTSSTDVYLVGAFNGWSTVADEFKKASADDTTAKVTMELEANTTYEFKIVKSSTWTSCNTTITDTVSGLSFTSSVSGNAKITTAEAGEYVFTYTLSSNKLAVTYPEAVVEPTYYEVGFDTGCDAYVASQTVEANDKVIKPVDPTREGFTFGGWYVDEALSTSYDFDTPVTGSFTLYAKWDEATTEPTTPSEPAEPETITVYFRNDWLWPEVYVHYWNNADAAVGTQWPGKLMTFVEKDETTGYDIYSAEVPADLSGLLFNGIENGKTGDDYRQQTPDVDTGIVDGAAWYIHWDGENKVSPFEYTPGGNEGGDEEPAEDVSYAATFHFVNTLNWSVVNLYTWIGSGTQLTGGWPGSATSVVGGYNTATVEYTAPANTDLNFIFNNGSTQTVDLTLPAEAFVLEGEVYKAEKWVVLTTQENGKYNAATVDSPEAIVTSPIVDGNSVTFNYGDNEAQTVAVAGSFNEWSATANPMTKGEDGVWTATVEGLVSGDYQYKFVVDGEYIIDPMNSNVVTDAEGNQNSAFYILSSEDEDDDNTVTVNIHYTRTDGKYDGWNLWVWGSNLGGHQVDFESTDENGAVVATIVLDNAREHQNISFKERLSVEGNEWKDQGNKDHSIDLSTVVSGTIDYYLPSGACVFGDDVIRKNKISSVELDYDGGVITVASVQAIANPEEALSLVKGEGDDAETIEVTITSVGSKYSLALPEGMTIELSDLYLYKVDYYGDLYAIAIDAVYASDRFAAEYTYEGKDLGATYTAASTTFKVWAPTATAVSVKLYATGSDAEAGAAVLGSYPMTKGDKGVWTVTIDGDLKNTYYTYIVTVDGEEVEAVDPYARTTGVNGNRGMVIDLASTDPQGWANDKNPNKITSYTDAVIYELHVRDFSNHASSGMTNKGKYLAFTEEGTKTSAGTSTGIDYLDDLGVTHVHLLPVYDYGSVDETTCTNFNWGYDPVNYNVPEGSYSVNPYDGNVRVNEFKQMVQSLHDHDISVIMDVVYNHVYNAEKFCFNNIVPGYFSRVDSNASGCGNDTASEREMIRKYIVESVLYWHQEYHIDGFRFDLVGLLDVGTINEIVTEVHKCCPDVIFYGEGWDMDGTNKEPGTQMAKQGNAPKTPGFAYFSDSVRNGVSGGNDGTTAGFVSGAGNGGAMVAEWMANPWWTNNPQQVVQYVSCHDNYTLADKLVLSTGRNKLDQTVIKMNNLAAAFYMTSQGISFIHAGEEFLREKINSDGSRNHNSYNSSDAVNNIVWSNLDSTSVDYAGNVEYYKGLIAFRKAHPALRLATAEAVKENVYIREADASLISFWVDGSEVSGETHDSIYVIFNANSSAKTVELPAGDWNVCINGETAGTDTIETVSGSVNVSGISAMVLVQEETEEKPTQDKSDVALPGSFNSWNQANFMDNTDVEGVVTQTLSLPEDTYEFKIKIGDNWYGNSGTIVDTTTTTAAEGWEMSTSVGDNCKLQASGGAYTFIFNQSTGKLIVEYDPDGGVFGDPSEYYLCGYINGADYATGFETGEYKFVDGKLTTTFTADSYVMVKNGDSSELYMTDGYQGAVKSAVLKDTKKCELTKDKWDKLLIPGGEEVVITMVKNDDNTITLSYETTTSAFEDKSGVQDGVTLHCWNWSFDNITANMATIAEQGYTAIQTSPIQAMKEATVGQTVGGHWWVYYQPVDFVINTDSGNALGTKTDFEEMCAAAEEYGIKVIVDVVANHLGNKTGNDLADAIPEYLRKDEYWHDISVNISNWENRENMTQYCLTGLPDLNTANEAVQGFVLDFLKECVDAGADGFRFDMAKSIETPKDDASFASDFWPNVVGGIQEYAGGDLYIYGEVLDDAKIAISAYTQYMSVTDNGWGNHMRTLVNGGTAGLVSGFYKSAPASNLVIWAESHDTYATDDAGQNSSGVSVANINKTWALVAARADAMGLYLARPADNSQLLGVASVTGWANEEVKAVNEFHNAFVGKSETIGNSDGIAYVMRDTTGIVLVNAAGTTRTLSGLEVGMTDGYYEDQITGNIFSVEDGKISGSIGSTGIAVVMEAEESTAVAKIGDAEYETLTDALAAVKSGETIVLVADVEENFVTLLQGNTLDLNGHVLTAEYVAAYNGNHIIDSSEKASGLLKVTRDHVLLMENPYLPIWNGVDGYVFAQKTNFNSKLEETGENSVKYTFLPYLDPAVYNLIANGTETSGVTLKVKVSWKASNGMPAFVTFTYSDDLVRQVAEMYTTSQKLAFTLNLTGTASVEDLAFEVFFESDTLVKHVCGVTKQ